MSERYVSSSGRCPRIPAAGAGRRSALGSTSPLSPMGCQSCLQTGPTFAASKQGLSHQECCLPNSRCDRYCSEAVPQILKESFKCSCHLLSFKMNGKGISLLTMDMFSTRAPCGGKTLFKVFTKCKMHGLN